MHAVEVVDNGNDGVARNSEGTLIIGVFCAASNITGILNDDILLTKYGWGRDGWSTCCSIPPLCSG